MKKSLFPCFVPFVAAFWIVYALATIPFINCNNVMFYLIPHCVFLILLIVFLFIFVKIKQQEHEEMTKENDLLRKIRWEEKQQIFYEKKKTFDKDFFTTEVPEKITFPQLLEFARSFKTDTEKKLSEINSEVEKLKSKNDISVEIKHINDDQPKQKNKTNKAE